MTKGWNVRTIEKGAIPLFLIGFKLVFLLPRGNFESISLKIILLQKLKELIIKRKYQKTVELIDKNRLSMNYVVILDVDGFVEKLTDFI